MRERTVTPSILLFLALVALPIAAAIGYALAYSLGLTGLLSEGFTLEHWLAACADGELWGSIALSVGIAAATVLLAGSFGLAIALVFGERLAHGPLSYLLYAPLAFPGTVAAFVTYQWLTQSGLLARLALAAGLIDGLDEMPPLVADRLAVGIVATHVAIATPFLALVFQRLFEQRRVAELCQLASTLGASRRQRLRRVALPVLIRSGASNLALVFVIVLGSYEVPLLLGRQSPQMLSMLIMRKYGRFDVSDKPEAFAIATVYSIAVVVIVAVIFARRRAADGR